MCQLFQAPEDTNLSKSQVSQVAVSLTILEMEGDILYAV